MKPRVAIDIRSYGSAHAAHRHDFAQLVLPISGMLEIDIAGRGSRLSPCRAAFVETEADHTQRGEQPNRSLIVDLDPAMVEPAMHDRLTRRPFVPLSPAANRLIDYMGLMIGSGGARADHADLWIPLLLDTISQGPIQPRSRLAPLLAGIEPQIGQPWTAEMMATRAGLSTSRLHALFRSELDTTPRAWLAELRLRKACEWLAQTDLSIAEIAYRAGFGDQSALTRALRRATGQTPAAYRRQQQETGPKIR